MKTKTILTTLLCIAALTVVRAQSTISSVTANYQYVNLVPVQITGMSAEQLQLENKTFTVNVALGVTTDVSKIAVMLGSSEGSNDMFYKEFVLGETGAFTDGTSYSITGNSQHFVIGQFSGPQRYYVESFAIMSDGNFSEAVRTEVQ